MSPKVGDAEICPCGKEIVAGQLHDGIRAVPPAFECIDPPEPGSMAGLGRPTRRMISGAGPYSFYGH